MSGVQTEQQNNWCQSVAGVVIHRRRVLLVRHTYGAGKGRLIVPGGYVRFGETPQQAVAREVLEETGVRVRAGVLIGIRFNLKDWYAAFLAEYIGGKPRADRQENSEAVWVDIEEAAVRDDVPDLTKKLLECAQAETVWRQIPFESRENHGSYSFYGAASYVGFRR